MQEPPDDGRYNSAVFMTAELPPPVIRTAEIFVNFSSIQSHFKVVFGLSIPVVFVVVVAVVSFFVVVVVVIVLYETDVSIGWTFIVVQTMHKELNPTVAKPKLKSKDSFKSRANFGEVEHLEFPMNIPMIRLIAKKIGFLKRIAIFAYYQFWIMSNLL